MCIRDSNPLPFCSNPVFVFFVFCFLFFLWKKQTNKQTKTKQNYPTAIDINYILIATSQILLQYWRKRRISRNSRICVLKEHWKTTSIFISIINGASLADFQDKFSWLFYTLSFITSLSSSEYFSYSMTIQPSCHINIECPIHGKSLAAFSWQISPVVLCIMFH